MLFMYGGGVFVEKKIFERLSSEVSVNVFLMV